MPDLYIFDFDSTLFRSPDRPDDWNGGWWSNPASLLPPMIPEVVTEEDFCEPVLAKLQSAERAGHNPVVVTGRMSKVRREVANILKAVGLQGLVDSGRLYTSSGSTLKFKVNKFRELVEERSRFGLTPVRVNIYDDRLEHLPDFDALMKLLVEEGMVSEYHIWQVVLADNTIRRFKP